MTVRGMARALGPAALTTLALAAAGCFLAPQPLPGAADGSACAADLDCATGLTCNCGVCGAPPAVDEPPSCQVQIDDRCGDVPASCFEACGVETIVGLAECVDGRETCAASGGVLRADCPDDTCWGEPGPGEVCVDGEFECAFGINPPTGLCYTFDCDGDPEACVTSCASDEQTEQICLAGEWTCEVGFPVRQCGGCVGTPPACYDNCDDLEVVAQAACVMNEWSCSFIVGAQLATDCCEDDVTIETAAEYAQLAGLKCSTGTVLVQDLPGGPAGVDVIELPSLVLAESVLLYQNGATEVRLPALARVEEAFSLWMNDDLTYASLPALESVGGSFEIAFNDSFPQCLAEQLRSQVIVGGDTFLNNNDDDSPLCADGGYLEPGDGGELDGGELDGGDVDGGPDLDAGVADGGGPPPPAAEHLLLCEVSATALERQFIEVVNVTGAPVDLSTVYLADDGDYALLPGAFGGAPAPTIDSGDFIARFPDGATLDDQQMLVVAIDGAGFFSTFGFDADFELLGTRAETPDLDVIGEGIGARLASAGEQVVLFTWDGAADLVQDLDVLQYGQPVAADALASKTGISVDGPDGDAVASTYQADALTQAAQSAGQTGTDSTKRLAAEEGAEPSSGGNGVTGHDETAEDTAATWEDPFTPADPSGCILLN